MDLFFDNVFHGLFTSLDPLGMILRTLMALLADALAQLIGGMYSQLFQITTVDFSTEAVGSIWRITTGLSVGLSTIMLIVAAFRSMLTQSNKYLMLAFSGIVLALLGLQVAAGKVRCLILGSPFFFVSARCWLKSRCDTGSFLGGGWWVGGCGYWRTSIVIM